MPRSPLNRRTFLHALGVCIPLPLLEAMLPLGKGASQTPEAGGAKRLLLIGRPLGVHAPYLFPEKAGPDYEPTRYLQPLDAHRGHFTVFSGVSHRGYPGGHGTEAALFTGVAPEGMRAGELRNTISLDQEVASHLGGHTRLASLSLGGGNLSWNRKGVQLPSTDRATQIFKELFIDGTPAEVAQALRKIEDGKSILDGVRKQAQSLVKTLGPADRRRLDFMLTSIREAEERLQRDRAWVLKPKPRVEMKPASEDHITDQRLFERERQWFELTRLALATDSCRVISLYLWSHTERLDLKGVAITHHDASHHGRDDAKIEQLALIEEAELNLFSEFLAKMRATDEGGVSLLDRTVVVYTSNLGNASAHTCDNLPVLLAGGGFKHVGHVAFDRANNKPLSNLFVRILHQFGIEIDHFGTSTGRLSEV